MITSIRDADASYMTDEELLAAILRSGLTKKDAMELASKLLAKYGWLGLQTVDVTELCQIHNMGLPKAKLVKSIAEISRRVAAARLVGDNLSIRSPTDAANLLMLEMSGLEQEHLRVLALNTKNRVIKIYTVYIGSVNTAVIRVGEIFREAVKKNATAVIITHNHPSGDPTPSTEDIIVTRQIVEAGKLLDIDVLDHLVIGAGRYVSMRERGMGFNGG